MKKKSGKILVALSGGGTGGSVVPLLSVARVLSRRHEDVDFLFFGTKNGPEFNLVADEKELNIKYLTISAGKLRRYFSGKNILDLFFIAYSFFQSLYLLIKYRPQTFIAAGAFVAVPPAFAAKILGIPVLMHQQDIHPGLANKIIAPLANLKTVAFEKSLSDYSGAIWVGNPVDEVEISRALIAKNQIKKEYSITDSLPFVLVTGGGTGANFLNQLVLDSLKEFKDKIQIVHLSGAGKIHSENHRNYQAYEFLFHENILKLIAASDLVVSRAGLGTLTELSALAKPTILVPIPNSHQEENARLFSKATVVLEQKELNAKNFSERIINILNKPSETERMSREIKKMIKPGAAEFLAEKIYEYSRKKS